MLCGCIVRCLLFVSFDVLLLLYCTDYISLRVGVVVFR